MTTDNILNREDADRFLGKLSLRVREDVILQVVEVLKENKRSLYDLYAQGTRRDGSTRRSVCGKGTAYKIKRLYEGGELDSYLSYLGYRIYISGLDDLTANLEKKKSNAAVRKDLYDFLSDWKSELSLPLNYLDNEDLSRGETGVPHVTPEIVIKWGVSADGEIVRRFLVEERDEFKEIQLTTQRHRKLWNNVKNCQQLGGAIIKECNKLAMEIRGQSEIRSGFKIVMSFEDTSKKKGVDRLFAWTVYADALDIFSEKWLERSYNFYDRGDGSCGIRWGGDSLAVVNPDVKDAVVGTHMKLRALYRDSPMVKQILELKKQLDAAETEVRKELDSIQEFLGL